MITSDQLELAREAVRKMGEALEDLIQVSRSLSKIEQTRVFSPECLGTISAFLEVGHGFEPFEPYSKAVKASTLLEIIEDEVEFSFDDENLEEEEQEEEEQE